METVSPREFGALEAEVKHLRHAVANMASKQDEIAQQVSELHGLVAQARGARWALVTVAGAAATMGALADWVLRHTGLR